VHRSNPDRTIDIKPTGVEPFLTHIKAGAFSTHGAMGEKGIKLATARSAVLRSAHEDGQPRLQWPEVVGANAAFSLPELPWSYDKLVPRVAASCNFLCLAKSWVWN